MAEPVLDLQAKLTTIAELPRAELKGWLWQLRHVRQRACFPAELIGLDLRQEASWTLG
jgi:hypothetical protein